VPPGFNREELRSRYDVPVIAEDKWHRYSGLRTSQIVARELTSSTPPSPWLLNAGAGGYELGEKSWIEVSLDLFAKPISFRRYAVCASIEKLPFASHAFGGVVCVGEVLAYCDPAAAISEFARVLAPDGVLICDFANSRSFRRWFTASFGRAADLIVDDYNEMPERTWIYDAKYIFGLLRSAGFEIRSTVGTHTWSGLARRFGASVPAALSLQRSLEWVWLPQAWADLTTVVALRETAV
jgi:SAM-dependent methyltransferase